MISLDQISKKLIQNDNVIIICHVSPDGDTLGSGLALYKFLKNLGKKRVEIVCDDEAYGKLGFLQGDVIIKKDIPDDTYDLAIAVDVATGERMGELRRFYYRARDRFAIDHHQTNDFNSSELYLVAKSSSTAEIMYEVLYHTEPKGIDKSVCECLYAGILTDSGAFYFPSTSSHTHEVLSKLYNWEIDANKIYYELFKKTDKNVFKLHCRVLNSAKFELDDKIAIITFKKEDFEVTNTQFFATEGCINKIQDIDSVIIAISIAEVGDNSFKVSFRSKGDFDVSICASRFGGGGHKNAAGCRISGNYFDVYDKVLRVAREAIC